jgi:hypothetical protein
MNMNTEWNEEPTGTSGPNWMQQAAGAGQWLWNQAANMQAPSLPAMQTPQQTVEEMIRQLRQERARQSYERNFGQSFGSHRSMASQGMGANVEAMRQKVRNWNTTGRRGP